MVHRFCLACLSLCRGLLSYCSPSSDSNIKDAFYDQGTGIPNTPRSVSIFSICKGSSEGPCYFVLQDKGMTLPNRGETFYVLFYFIFKGRPSKPNKYILRIWDKCFLNKTQVNPRHPTHSECHTVSSRVRKTKFTLKHQYFHTPWGEMLS